MAAYHCLLFASKENGRLRDREDQKIEYFAKERTTNNDAYGEKHIPTVLTSANDKIGTIAHDVGVDLGRPIWLIIIYQPY